MDNNENNESLNEEVEKLSIEEKVIPKEDTEELIDDVKEEDVVLKEEVSPKEESEEHKENVRNGSKKSKKRKIIFVVSLILILIVIFICGIVCINKINPNAYKNLYVLGIDMSGKSLEQIAQELNEKFANYIPDNIFSITPEEVDFAINIPATAKKVLEYGRTGNLITDNVNIMKAFFSKVDIEPEYSFSEEKLDEKMINIDLSLKDRVENDKYSLDENTYKLIITRGKTGNSINYEEEKKNIINKFASAYINPNTNDTNIILNIAQKKPSELNLDEVYSKVKRDPKDAYIDETSNPIKMVSEVVGLDFDVNE